MVCNLCMCGDAGALPSWLSSDLNSRSNSTLPCRTKAVKGLEKQGSTISNVVSFPRTYRLYTSLTASLFNTTKLTIDDSSFASSHMRNEISRLHHNVSRSSCMCKNCTHFVTTFCLAAKCNEWLINAQQSKVHGFTSSFHQALPSAFPAAWVGNCSCKIHTQTKRWEPRSLDGDGWCVTMVGLWLKTIFLLISPVIWNSIWHIPSSVCMVLASASIAVSEREARAHKQSHMESVGFSVYQPDRGCEGKLISSVPNLYGG